MNPYLRFLKSSCKTVGRTHVTSLPYGIVQYQPQNDKPQVLLLKNRMYQDDFKIDHKALAMREEEIPVAEPAMKKLHRQWKIMQVCTDP